MSKDTNTVPKRIVIATRNAGKLAEFRGLFAELPIEVIGLGETEVPNNVEAEETGNTFRANAEMKAKFYARASDEWTLADDSGLEVSALGGRPGVYSARYSGENATATSNNAKLLAELSNTPEAGREARFVCVIAVSDAAGNIVFMAEGECVGTIARESRGSGGFGYDPLFIPEGSDRTFGEMSAADKQKISHRALASAIILRYLRDFIAS
jgi:XTP/dITP diphosphohydrolase